MLKVFESIFDIISGVDLNFCKIVSESPVGIWALILKALKYNLPVFCDPTSIGIMQEDLVLSHDFFKYSLRDQPNPTSVSPSINCVKVLSNLPL